MAKREWIRIGLCGIVGLIIGIILAIKMDYILSALIAPFYAIGSFYGIRLILGMLAGIGKTAGRSLFASIAVGFWLGIPIMIVLLIIALALVLTFGWIIGIFIAAKDVFVAYRTDSEMKGSSSSDNDGWGSGSVSSGTIKKSKKKKSNEYDELTW